MPVSDAKLVKLAQAGVTEAFDKLVALHQNQIFALAFRMLGNIEDAADIQQETFVRAWRSIRKFRLDSELSTWLHKIAINLCLTRKHRKQAENLTSLDEDIQCVAAEPGTVACLESAYTKSMVRKVLAGLPAHHRALIVLREIEGRPFDEIANILGCSVASARMRASKARALLRERLEPYLAEEDL